jgi:hypothetical protein
VTGDLHRSCGLLDRSVEVEPSTSRLSELLQQGLLASHPDPSGLGIQGRVPTLALEALFPHLSQHLLLVL